MALARNLIRNTARLCGGAFGNDLRRLQTVALPDLPYDYDSLEPAISRDVMQLHHQKHHKAYVDNHNKALEQLEQAMLKGDIPSIAKCQSAINLNGGGHINHSIFWQSLAPYLEGGGEPPRGYIEAAIDLQFGSLDALMQKVNNRGAALQGSGWVWVAIDKDEDKLAIETTTNEEILVAKGASLVPLIGIDVWEHAYYLQYKHSRAEYLKGIWRNISWRYASQVYDEEFKFK